MSSLKFLNLIISEVVAKAEFEKKKEEEKDLTYFSYILSITM